MAITQCDKVLEYMRRYGSITPLQAQRDLGCMRLAARIADLRKRGHSIGRRTKSGKSRDGNTVNYAEYYLEEDNNA